jgi:hypothetical protein
MTARAGRALEAGDPATWLHEAREELARRTLGAERTKLQPVDAAREYVILLGVGALQDYGRAFLRHVEDGEPEPAVPAGLRWRAAQIRAVLSELTPRHRYRL